MDRGYLIFRNLIPPERLESMRASYELEQARRDRAVGKISRQAIHMTRG